ncbi:hypothetical protein FRB99_002388 [Tulasnella sp. 403]|nr:hypothetical protein FRB99_002388 [Tulasnella sp. 403]
MDLRSRPRPTIPNQPPPYVLRPGGRAPRYNPPLQLYNAQQFAFLSPKIHISKRDSATRSLPRNPPSPLRSNALTHPPTQSHFNLAAQHAPNKGQQTSPNATEDRPSTRRGAIAFSPPA